MSAAILREAADRLVAEAYAAPYGARNRGGAILTAGWLRAYADDVEASGLLAEAAAVEERSTHPARTLVDTAAMREDLDDCTRDEQARTWAIASDALDALDATRAQVAEMVAADVRTETAAARRRLAERAASYEGTADRLAAKGFGDDASCMRTVAKELREVARELLS